MKEETVREEQETACPVCGRMKPARLRAEIDGFLESLYEESKRIAGILAESFKDEAGKTQVRNLENAVNTAVRFTEILNFIKNQVGKDQRRKNWARRIDAEPTGGALLRQLEKIEKKAQEIAPSPPEETLRVKLEIARGWVRQVAAHYLYAQVCR